MGNRKQRLYAVVKYPSKPDTPWKVDIPATVAGTRTRKFFVDRNSAQTWAQNFVEQLFREGADAAIAAKGPTVKTAVWKYVSAKTATCSDRYAQDLRLYATRAEEAWSSSLVSAIKLKHIEKWLDRPEWSGRTRANALAFLRTFLEWCRRRDYVEKNEAEKLSDEVKKPAGKKEILSPLEMRILLHLTKRDPVMRAFVVLGGFAGVRTIEIQRTPGAAVDHEHGEIYVGPDATKKTRGGWSERYVTMTKAFKRHCPKLPKGAIMPKTVRQFSTRMKHLRIRMHRFTKRIGLPNADRWKDVWPDNCLRHSFASYHLAEHGDAGKTAHQMGHTSSAMVYRAYAQAVRKADAEAWWAL